MNRLSSVGGRVAIVLIAAGLVTAAAIDVRKGPAHVASVPPTTAPAAVSPPADPGRSRAQRRIALTLPVLAALTAAGLSLRAPPVPVPLVIEMPSIGASIPVLGVGLTPGNAMEAPEGPADDAVWQQAFWYRGSAIPGARSTALIAGHIDDPLGRSGAFGQIGRLEPGDPIVVHDTRTGLNVRFAVTGSTTVPLAETTNPSVLREMYGAGPVAGKGPQPSADGLAHLTLVTCAGTFQSNLGTHDHRLIVFATRIS